jgi:hypothetical protein
MLGKAEDPRTGEAMVMEIRGVGGGGFEIQVLDFGVISTTYVYYTPR